MNDKDLTERELDQLLANQMDAIGEMIHAGDNYKLLTEIIYTFGSEMQSHGNVEKSAINAVNEWIK